MGGVVNLDDYDFGPHWFHCDGPDGPCVLLVIIQAWTDTVIIVDDACREERWSGRDGWLHKWRPYHIEPVARPAAVMKD